MFCGVDLGLKVVWRKSCDEIKFGLGNEVELIPSCIFDLLVILEATSGIGVRLCFWLFANASRGLRPSCFATREGPVWCAPASQDCRDPVVVLA
jgi:hypothetical protein